MEKRELKVSLRAERGKEAAKKLRRRGLLPAVLYGRSASRSVALDPKELRKLLGEEEGMNVILTLKAEGDSDLDGKMVMLKELQLDPVRHHYLHADLQEVFMDQKIRVTVPIHFVGKARGLETGGIVQPSLRALEVECLPGQMPDFIAVEISSLEVGDSIHIADLRLPEGVEAAQPGELPVVSVLAPAVEKVVKAEEEAAAAPAEEPKEEPARSLPGRAGGKEGASE